MPTIRKVSSTCGNNAQDYRSEGVCPTKDQIRQEWSCAKRQSPSPPFHLTNDQPTSFIRSSGPILFSVILRIRSNFFGNHFDHVVSILTTSWLTPQNACWPLTCSRDCFVFCLFTSTPPSSFFSPTTSADNPCLMPPLLPSCCCWWWLLSTADCWLLVLVSLVAALIQLATRTSSCRTRRTSSCIRAPTMLHRRFCNWNEVD